MIAEANVYGVLAGTDAVAVLCGDRIYPDEAPGASALPYLVIQRISTDPATTRDQGDPGATHLDGVRLQLTAIAATPSAAAGLLHAARLALEASLGVQAIWLDQRSIGREEGAQAYGVAGDFLTWKEPA
jgi:hypothetical protein